MKKHISKTVAVIIVLCMLFTPLLPVTALAMEDPLILPEGEISEPSKEAEGEMLGDILGDNVQTGLTEEGLGYAYNNTLAVITGYSGTAVDVIIPKTIDGKTVTAIGYSAFENKNIKSVVIEAEITDIPDKCFWSCHYLETVTFPTTLKSIGNSAFHGCYALSCPITLDGVEVEGQAFAFAHALTTVSIKNADSIGFYAFAGCDALTSLTIENVKAIENQSFMDCTSLNSVSLKDVETIGSEAFSGCTTLGKVVLPDGLKNISSSTFADCTLLSGVYIPESVAGISNTAFANDSFLTIYGKAGSYAQTYAVSNGILFVIGEIPDISTGSAVTDDGLHYAYSGNSAVITGYSGSSVNTTIPKTVDGKTVTAIAYAAFDSARIKSVVIEAEITDIPDKCFWSCHYLETVTFPTTLKSIGNSAFHGCYALSCPITLDGVEVEGQAFAFAHALTTVSIKNADSIGFYAFAGCDALTSLTIENVSTINHQAFMDCTALTELTMKNVGQIGGEAFSGCTTLSKAVLPEGLKTISSEAFADCTLLSGVYIPASVTSINETAFAHDYFLIISAEDDGDDGDDSEATDSYPIQFAKQHGHRYVRICFHGTGDDRGWNGHIDHEHIYDYDGRHGFYVMTDHGWAWFDQDAVGHIQDHLGGCDLELACREVNENPNSGNKEFNEEVEHIRDRGGIVYDLTLTADGESILFSEGGQGSVDISVPFESDCEDVYVYHIDDHGNKTRVPAIYNKKTGEVYFNTPHFSSYSVEPKSTVELEINNACNALVQENPDSSGVLLIAFYLSNGQMVSCEQGTLDSMNDVELPVQWVTCKIFLLGNNYAPVASDEISAK